MFVLKIFLQFFSTRFGFVCLMPGLQWPKCYFRVFIPYNLIGLRCFFIDLVDSFGKWHLPKCSSFFACYFAYIFLIQQHSVPSFADVDLYKWCLLEFDYFHLCDLKRAKRFGTAKKLKRIAFNSTFVSIALPSYSNFNSILLSILPSLSWDV